jgi:replicative DNA helicase
MSDTMSITGIETGVTVQPGVPHNREAEEAVLGAVLINPDVLREISWLRADDFYIHRNRWVWMAMLALDKKGIPVDLVTLGEEIERSSYDVQLPYLTSLLSQTPTSLHAGHYAEIVSDHARRRNDIQIANKIASGAYSTDGVDRAHIIDLLTKNTGNRTGALPVKNLLSAFYDGVVERSKDPRDVWGISTGITMLDKATGGLHRQQTTMLAGSPGVGKTTLLLQIMLEAAKHGWKVGIYELEMDAERLLARLISMLTGVPIRDMKSGRMEHHWDNFNRGMALLEPLGLYICDNPVMDTAQVRADISRIKALHGLDLVGLDYLNLLTDRDGDDDNRNTTAKAVRFRQTCREFDVSGVSVQSITKEGMRAIVPTLADMSGPAEVGFSADNVFFMVQDADSKIDFTLLPAKMRDSDVGRTPIPLRRPQGKIQFGEPARL